MLGYLYQCRYALLAGLRASKSKPAMVLSIERFDDIAFEDGTDLKQAGLTDFLNQHDGDYCIADVPSRWDIGGAKVWGAGGRYRSAEWGLTVL